MNLSLKETPQSVSVITSKRMEDQQLNNLVDVLKNTTGVTMSNSGVGDTGSAVFFSRGYEIKNFQVDGAPTSIFINDFSGQENIDTAIYDSVSVVRGATGLLTGSGDPSGSINLVRKKPTKEFQATLETQAGRWDKYRGVVDIGGGFNEDDSIRGRFIALHNEGGYYHPLFDRRNSILYGVVEANLGDSTTISSSWERTETKANGDVSPGHRFVSNENFEFIGLTTYQDRYTWNMADWSQRNKTRDILTMALEQHINDSWNINASYNHIKDKSKVKESTCYGGFLSDNSCLDYRARKSMQDDNANTIDIKLNGTFDLWGQTHDLVFGFNGKIEKEDSVAFRAVDLNPQTDMKLINNRLIQTEPTWGHKSTDNTETQQYGTFISTKLNFTDDFSAILGGRYSEWKTKTIWDGVTIGDDRKFDNFLPYLALTYDITDNLTTYASYTEIFNPQSAKDRDDKFLDPETGFNYEVGLKGEWFDGKLNSSIALFQSGKDNMAVIDYINGEGGECHRTPTGGCASKAEDDTKNRGWEFEIAGEITPNWQVQVGYSESILRDSKNKIINEGVRPVRTASLFTTYKPISELTLGGGVRWQSETWSDWVKNGYINSGHSNMSGEATQDDYYVVDLMANYEFNKNLSLLVNINNALNKEYKTNIYTFSYGEERNYIATLKYKF